MLELLGADQRTHNVQALSAKCLQDLDTSRDGTVSKSTSFLSFEILLYYYY